MYTYDNLNSELTAKFAPKKDYSSKLAVCYSSLGLTSKSERVYACGSYLDFSLNSDDTVSLHYANFCKDGLCAMCSWRKSMKLSNQVYRCVSALKDNYSFIFVTLTVKNCVSADLRNTLKLLNKSYAKLIRRKRLSFIRGAFKALEITYNNKTKTYHPHLHAIWVVDKKYFCSNDYLPTSELVEFWQQSLCVDYKPLCYVERIRKKNKKKNALSSAVAEVAKYPVKASDYLRYDFDTNKSVVAVLSEALCNVRTFQFYGILKDMRKELDIKDDDDDLVHVEDDVKVNKAVVIAHIIFRWNSFTSSYYNYDVIPVDNYNVDYCNNPNPVIDISVDEKLIC